jgi:hypothetical protein
MPQDATQRTKQGLFNNRQSVNVDKEYSCINIEFAFFGSAEYHRRRREQTVESVLNAFDDVARDTCRDVTIFSAFTTAPLELSLEGA